MGALSAAYCHIKCDFLKSGLYYFYRLPGGIGGMGLCVYLFVPARLSCRDLSESFSLISAIFAEKTLSGLSVTALCA